MYLQSFYTIAPKLSEDFATQNHQHLVHRRTDRQTERKADGEDDSSIRFAGV